MRINSPARGVNVAQNLTRIEQNKLLTLAREAIIGYVREETIPNRDAPEPNLQVTRVVSSVSR